MFWPYAVGMPGSEGVVNFSVEAGKVNLLVANGIGCGNTYLSSSLSRIVIFDDASAERGKTSIEFKLPQWVWPGD